jgi:hypothetical protein
MKGWQRRQRIEEIHDSAAQCMRRGDCDIDCEALLEEVRSLIRGAPTAHTMETMILLGVAGRIRAKETHGLLRSLFLLREEQGETDLFTRVETRIAEYLAPDMLTPHGYGPTFATLPHDDVWAHVRALISAVEGFGYHVFLNSGTLLGVIRDGRLIEHDDDIDLAVFLDAHDAETAAREWVLLRARLEKTGMFDHQASNSQAIHKLTSIGHVQVDLFPLWFDDCDRVHLYPHTVGELTRDQVFPLKKCARSGLNLPAEPELMLAVNYGQNWHVPDPYFRFDWSRQKKKFAGFRRALRKQMRGLGPKRADA